MFAHAAAGNLLEQPIDLLAANQISGSSAA